MSITAAVPVPVPSPDHEEDRANRERSCRGDPSASLAMMLLVVRVDSTRSCAPTSTRKQGSTRWPRCPDDQGGWRWRTSSTSPAPCAKGRKASYQHAVAVHLANEPPNDALLTERLEHLHQDPILGHCNNHHGRTIAGSPQPSAKPERISQLIGEMARGARVLHLLLALFLTLQSTPASADMKVFAVFSKDQASASVLSALIAGLTSNFRILCVFKGLNGIGLKIEDGFVPAIQNLDGVVAVIPDRLHKLHTPRSWEFLGLETDGKASADWEFGANYGNGTIIGIVDTGVSPISQSFRDDCAVVIPNGWRGKCESKETFGCNKKLIGARLFNAGMKANNLVGPILDGGPVEEDPRDLDSPWDFVGHGSHTTSTAGGCFVEGVSVFGRGKGTAKGGSPRANVASYKACFARGCSGVDILMAILTAVDDGVHVLSLSLGAPATDYVSDLIALGTLYAVLKNVTVVASAGNDGPVSGSVTNLAPWILTVGASTMDRSFPAEVTFGTTTIKGQSLSNSTQPLGTLHPMISGEKANAAGQSSDNSKFCLAGTLDPAVVKDKIVFCTRGVNGRVEKGLVVKQAGGIGMVLCSDAGSGKYGVLADPHLIPTAHCSSSQCEDLFRFPKGSITTKDAELGVKPAATMAFFSSRGPNTITPQILKPDITAPGVSVIAAFSLEVSPTFQPSDGRRVPYTVMSGTSMSCPHVAGIAGLVKSKHPDWSPAMIKSAIMTTASTGANDGGQIQDEKGAPATPFSYGSGDVRPISALDPGLVYDTTPSDYANFICSLRPTQLPIGVPPALVPLFVILFGFNANPFRCSLSRPRPEDLNYPSISAACLSGTTTPAVKRRVKNVGAGPAKYTVTVVQPAAGVRITVEPSTLTFTKIGEEKEFTVKLDVVDAARAADYVFGSFEWKDESETHRVRSPVVATTKCA